MAISESPTRTKYPLSSKKIVKKTIVGVIGFFILGLIFNIGIIITLVQNRQSGGIVIFEFVSLLIFAVIALLVYLYQKWYFDFYYYDFNASFITIRKGPITPREITIPYERVQDVYVDQDIIDRLFGLYDVHLSSATITSGMEAHIDGLEKPAADGLREELLHTVSQKINSRMQPAPMPNAPQPLS